MSELKSNSAMFAFNTPHRTTKTFSVMPSKKLLSRKKFSSFNKLQRVISWCHRFVTNLRRKPTERSVGPLRASELRKAHDIVKCPSSTLWTIQNHFGSEIASLKKGKFIITYTLKVVTFRRHLQFSQGGGVDSSKPTCPII